MKSLVGDRPSWHKEPINFLNKMLSIRKVRLLITSRYIAMQSYECVIISKMFLIYLISYGCNGGALVFLGGAEASASPSFALPMFITIKKIIILHLFLGVPAATVGGTGTPWHTRGYAPALMYCSIHIMPLTLVCGVEYTTLAFLSRCVASTTCLIGPECGDVITPTTNAKDASRAYYSIQLR